MVKTIDRFSPYKLSRGWEDQCFREFTVLKRDVEICELITDIYPRDLCYSAVAGALNDITICDKIDSEGVKKICNNKLMRYNR